jgi:hypothetical protein
MPLRPPAGFIRPGFDPLKNPNAPTIGTATGGDQSASVAFTPPANVGGSAISAYYAVSSPGQVTVTGASSPINVTGLTNGTAYTFAVWALNTYGPGPFSAASNSVTPALLQRAVFAGGVFSGVTCTNVMDYVEIGTLGNAIDFGDLNATRGAMSGVGAAQNGYFCGGQSTLASSTSPVATEYGITFATTGNSSNFGSLTVARAQLAACGNTTRSVIMGGFDDSTSTGYTTIDYFNPTSAGSAISFGSLTGDNLRYGAGFSSPTRGLLAGGGTAAGSGRNTIQYITIATTGNSLDFGDLTWDNLRTSGCSSSTRGIIVLAGSSNRLDYVTIATTGNASDFGDLIDTNSNNASTVSSQTRGLVAMGSTNQNVIQYLTIATLGNASDFGDLTVARWNGAGASNCNGGLQ